MNHVIIVKHGSYDDGDQDMTTENGNARYVIEKYENVNIYL